MHDERVTPPVVHRDVKPDLDEIERLALAATQGDWLTGCHAVISTPDDDVIIGEAERVADAAFIAAANPAAVLGLVAELRRLDAVAQRFADDAEHLRERRSRFRQGGTPPAAQGRGGGADVLDNDAEIVAILDVLDEALTSDGSGT